MKCPKCGGLLVEKDGGFVCEGCGTRFKKKSTQNEQKQETNVVSNTAEKTEEPIQQTKQGDEKSELELLKERLAEMEKRQAEIESNKGKQSGDGLKKTFEQFKETKFFAFLKKWGLKVVLPCALVLIVFISLMVSLVGVRGVYYNVDNPNEFYSFSSSGYKYYGDFNGEEYVDKGTWKTKDGKLLLTYNDEDFGKQTDEYYFSKQSNDVIFIGEEKDSLSEFRRVTLLQYNPSSSKKCTVIFDANGGNGDANKTYALGSKSEKAPEVERDGYFFKGWYKDKYGYKMSGSKRYEEGKRVWEDATYYANWWSDRTYTVTVEGVDIALELEEGDNLLSKLKETEKGYTYNYFIDGVQVDENTVMPNYAITVTRQQTSVKKIKITLNAVGGTFDGVSEITKEVEFNSSITLDVPKSEGMLFAGYVVYPKDSDAVITVTDTKGNINDNFWNTVFEDMTLYAAWINLETELAGFEYSIKNYGICITKYVGNNSVVKIPDFVVGIGDNAFKNCTELTSITIPSSITNLGNNAFSGCTNLKNIYYQGDIAKWCSSECGDVLSTGGTLYINGQKIEGDLIIPSGVTSIRYKAFYGCTGLTSVVIPSGVRTIEDRAFAGCVGLTSVVIPDSVSSIGAVFDGCTNLKNIYYTGDIVKWCSFEYCGNIMSTGRTLYIGGQKIEGDLIIPNGVTNIGSSAFSGCVELTSVTIPISVTSVGRGAFSDCTNLKNIYYTGDIAKWCSIEYCYNILSTGRTLYIGGQKIEGDLIIPNGVTNIGSSAFSGCVGLTSVTIPTSVTKINARAFSGCTNLKNIYYTGDIAKWCSLRGIANILSTATTLYIGGQKIEGDLIIPDGITNIGEHSFYMRTELTSVIIPNSVISIGDGAFYGCTGLTSVTLGNGVKTIANGTFSGCVGLTSLTIPSSLTKIDTDAFKSCTNLKNIYYTGDIAEWCSSACGGVLSTGRTLYIDGKKVEGNLTIPNGVKTISSAAFLGCIGLTSITIPSSVTRINSLAFDGCTNLKNIYYQGDIAKWCSFEGCGNLLSIDRTLYIDGQKIEGDLIIPNGVTRIAYKAFYGCAGLKSVTIPTSVTEISSYAFWGCTGLTNITIPSSMNEIYDGVFGGCSGLTSVTIPNSVTCIYGNSFRGCTGLTSITIPSSVKEIDFWAFDGCTNLKNIYYQGDIAKWCSSECGGVLSTGRTLYIDGKKVEGDLIIPSGVRTIEVSAFRGCTGLTSITIPSSVKEIHFGAFSGCKMLTKIVFDGTKAQWNAIVFHDWSNGMGACTIYCSDGTIKV